MEKGGGKQVVENPLSRVGHTQVAAFGAFSKTGGRRGSYAPFGHIGSRVQPQQCQRWRVEMCIFEWCEVVIEGLIEPSAGSRQWWSPGFPGLRRLHVGDGALWEVDVETEEMKVLHRF